MTLRHLMMLMLPLALAGCINSADAKKADDATAQFYQQVAAKSYRAIYDGAATDLRNSISSDDFVALMQRIDQNMGACGPPVKRFDIHINITQQGTFRDQGYTRKCANGDLAETVTIVIRNGEAKLAGYHLGNPAAASAENE
ncbi:MAG TPA: hypothetical protein VN805_01965 [Caulobacteraceae bacterium]|nr:hypothetical protein [Caulobacteraceae bacterium]